MNKIVMMLTAVVLFLGSSFLSFHFFASSTLGGFTGSVNYKAPSTSGSPSNAISNEPKTEACPLNGELLTKSQKDKWLTRRPLGIMIENHVEARPQSGLSSADVVYEAVAEGGITRFLAIFYCQDAPFVGPVRSARMHFIAQLAEYGENPLYAHVGGANCDSSTGSGCANGAPADALGEIGKLGWDVYNDLNQFAVPFPYYWRDPDRLPGRATEHTVYSTTDKLWSYAKTNRSLTNVDKKGVSWDKTFTPWNFKEDAALSQRGAVGKISFGFWSSFSDYNVSWVYDKPSNMYKRFNAGQPHMDKNTNKQLAAKNIVVVLEKESPANDGYPGGHLVYGTTGSGDAIVFQDGTSIKATWKKKDFFTRMRFYDAAGREIAFNRGQVFIEIVPTGNTITY